MAVPVVSWRKSDKTVPTLVNFGVVDAGSQSVEIELFLANNYPEVGVGDPSYVEVSKMENCRITTKSKEGGLDGDIIEEKWIAVHCNNLNQVTAEGNKNYFPVGSNEIMEDGKPKKIEVASFVCSDLVADYTSATTPASPTDKQVWRDTSQRNTLGDIYKRYNAETSQWDIINEISGGKWIDGEFANNKKNIVQVTLMATVPSSALAGIREFKTRARYSFV